MTHTIQNQYLRATIDEMGAELVSLQRLSDGHEYLWHGDARWWHGHCPILFPATGGLWNGTYRHDGVSMGHAGADEYAVSETDEEKVRQIMAALDSVGAQ